MGTKQIEKNNLKKKITLNQENQPNIKSNKTELIIEKNQPCCFHQQLMGPTENTKKFKLPWSWFCLLITAGYQFLKYLASKIASSINGSQDNQEILKKYPTYRLNPFH